MNPTLFAFVPLLYPPEAKNKILALILPAQHYEYLPSKTRDTEHFNLWGIFRTAKEFSVLKNLA
jgi:hypothetical protein